jgi:hypothetical protein
MSISAHLRVVVADPCCFPSCDVPSQGPKHWHQYIFINTEIVAAGGRGSLSPDSPSQPITRSHARGTCGVVCGVGRSRSCGGGAARCAAGPGPTHHWKSQKLASCSLRGDRWGGKGMPMGLRGKRCKAVREAAGGRGGWRGVRVSPRLARTCRGRHPRRGCSTARRASPSWVMAVGRAAAAMHRGNGTSWAPPRRPCKEQAAQLGFREGRWASPASSRSAAPSHMTPPKNHPVRKPVRPPPRPLNTRTSGAPPHCPCDCSTPQPPPPCLHAKRHGAAEWRHKPRRGKAARWRRQGAAERTRRRARRHAAQGTSAEGAAAQLTVQ